MNEIAQKIDRGSRKGVGKTELNIRDEGILGMGEEEKANTVEKVMDSC